jgi:pimeloyl-ACP methyl ester carboxylesterase
VCHLCDRVGDSLDWNASLCRWDRPPDGDPEGFGNRGEWICSDRGIDQWISIRGENRENPVIVIVHGGPGVANSALLATYSGWEKYFTVVQWDQRGSGKTFGRNGKATPDMTIDRFVQDGLEVVQYARKRLSKDRVILLGHSWGSFLGVTIVKKRPELFSAYVGTGQVVGFAQGMTAQYAYIMKRAEADGNQEALRDLREIGPPPYRIGPKFFTLQKLDDLYALPVDAQYLQKMMETVRTAPNYSSQDVQDWMGGRQFSMELMVPDMTAMDLPATQGYEMPIPFFIIQGEEDHITPTIVVEDYFEKIRAPRKELVLIKGAGHFAYATNGDEFLALLLKSVGTPAEPTGHSASRSR